MNVKTPVQNIAATMDGTHKWRIARCVNQKGRVIVNLTAIKCRTRGNRPPGRCGVYQVRVWNLERPGLA